MKFSLETTGLKAAAAALDGFSERRLGAAIATALTRTAVVAKDRAQRDLVRSLDRPTPYTQRALYMRPATAQRQVAEVFVKDDLAGSGTPATKYLLPQVDGGGRHIKRFEKALQAAGAMPYGFQSVPAVGAKLDGYGNMSRGQIIQILSQVGTELVAGHSRTLPRLRGDEDKREKRLTQNKRRRAFGRSGGQYVAIPRPKGKLKPGIYLAEGRNFGAKWGLGRTGRLVPVLIFVKATTYRPRYDFYGTVNAAVNEQLGTQMQRALDEQAQRLAAAQRGQP